MSWLARTADRLSILKELFGFLWERKLWWMIPAVLVLVVVGVLLLIVQGSAIAPFIYPLF